MFVKCPEEQSPRTAAKTTIIIRNSNKEEFKEQVTGEGEEINVKFVAWAVTDCNICRIF